MEALIRVQTAEPLTFPYMRVTFTNGEQRTIDLLPYFPEGPLFNPLRTDLDSFQAVHVAGGTLTWPNGADIDPDVLYYGGSPPWAPSENAVVDTPTEAEA